MRSIVRQLTIVLCIVLLGVAQGTSAPPEKDSPSAHLAKLNNPDPKVQSQGLFDIGFGHDGILPCLPALARIATTSNALESQTRSLEIIAEIGPHAVAVSRQLYGLLRHSSPEIRIAAADAILRLERRNEQAVDVLANTLSDSDVNAELRAKATNVLQTSQLAGQRAVPQLIAASADRDEKVRIEVARALGDVTPRRREDVVEALRKLLGDSSLDVRGAAAESLWQLDEPADRLVPALIELVERHNPEPTPEIANDVWGHDAGVELLGRIGPEAKAAVPALLRALDSPQVGERIAAADALGNIGLGANPAVARLATSLRDTETHAFPFVHRAWHVSDNAAVALGKIGDATRPVLIAALSDDDKRVRALAVQQLPRLTMSEEMVPAVAKLLDDEEKSVRALAAFSLGRMGRSANSTVPKLVAILNDDGSWTSFPGGGGIGMTYGIGQHAFEALIAIRPQGAEFLEAMRTRMEQDRRLERAFLELLLHLGPAAKPLVPALEPLLRDETRRLAAAAALSRIEPNRPALLEILRTELTSDNIGKALAAARAIGNLGVTAKPAIPALYELLDSGATSMEGRAILATAIIRIDSQEQRAVRALAEALPECPSSHDAAHDRAELDECRVVWRSLGPKAAPAIEQLLAELAPKAQDLDADSFLGPQQAAKRRLECAKLLLEVSQATANQVTLRVLNALIQLGDSDDCVVRGHTARTLAAMGPLAGPAIPMLVKMLVDEEPYWEGGDFYGNGGIQNLPADQAIDALGKIGKPAVPALKLALSDEDRRMRERAARALGRMGEPARDAVSDLTRALDDPSFVVRAVAAESLGNVQVDRDDVLNALADRLSDSHLRVRLAAIRALGQFGPRAERHLPRLEPLENSPFEDCQRAARDAIKRISS